MVKILKILIVSIILLLMLIYPTILSWYNIHLWLLIWFQFLESFDLDLTAIPSSSDEVDSNITDKAEFETDDVKTTCSVASAETDSLAQNDEDYTDSEDDEDEADEEYDDEFTDSEFEEEFEFISQDDLWFYFITCFWLICNTFWLFRCNNISI